MNNRRYIGEYTYRDVVVPDGIPAIVPQDLFDRVQEKLAKNKKTPARHKAEDDYLLTTKLFCGYCGAYLCGESGTSRTGNVHHYYKCVSVKKKRQECHKKSVKKGWIEDLVVGETMKIGNVKKCAVGKHPKSEKHGNTAQFSEVERSGTQENCGGIGSGCRLRLRPLPVLHRRQSQRVARIDPNAVVVDKNIAENDRFDLFSR